MTDKFLKYYNDKNDYFASKKTQWHELDTSSFLHLIFNREIDEDPALLPFEETWCESYDWWLNNKGTDTPRPPEYKFVYNGICQAIYKRNDSKNKTYILTNNHSKLSEILENPFVIISPISYVGKRRTKQNARYLYAIVIDIDEVDAKNVANLLFQTDRTRPLKGKLTYPQPNIIVNSGSGIHIYYLLETPVPMFEGTYKLLNKIKRELTWRAWNIGTTHLDPNRPQYQGNCQGFRLPGTQTKFRTKVRAYHNIAPSVPPYYKISDLATYGNVLTEEERNLIEKGGYKPQRTTLKEAKELYPEWYEKRIIKKMPKKRWVINRGLYDWFLKQIYQNVKVGHRYFCCMALAIYAKKCLIPEEELDKDLSELVLFLDSLSSTGDNRFTIEDAMDAKTAYKECYCTFPREDISKITGIPIKEARHNGLNQNLHLMLIRQRQEMMRKVQNLGDWRQGNGRKDKSAEVAEWRKNNPDGTKAQCCRDLNLDKKTVYKWWEQKND